MPPALAQRVRRCRGSYLDMQTERVWRTVRSVEADVCVETDFDFVDVLSVHGDLDAAVTLSGTRPRGQHELRVSTEGQCPSSAAICEDEDLLDGYPGIQSLDVNLTLRYTSAVGV